jgi:putative ABC transport system permease protein
MLADLKSAARALTRMPSLTFLAVCTLALGIGAAVAIFSLVDAVLLRPLPYFEPEQLARVYTEFPNAPGGGQRARASTTEYFELAAELQSWQSLDAWATAGANLATAAEPARVTASFVTGGLFGTLGVAPQLGRVVGPQDTVFGAPPVAVISYGLWQRAFGGERAVIGREVLLNGEQRTIVGVMPARFAFPLGEADTTDVWPALQIDPALPVNDHSVFLVGRLKPGVAVAAAQAELDAVVKRQGEGGGERGHHFDPANHTLVAHALGAEVVRGVRPALQMLFGAVGFLLLIACVNVANLLLSRAEARHHDIAIRSALGAGLGRLGRQFATEGIVLASLGAALGLLLAQGALQLVRARGGSGIPQAAGATIDAHVLLFAVALSVATGLVFGLAPLLHVVKRNLHGAVRSSAATATSAASTQRFRQTLIVGQLALALVLLTGTGLMLRTFWNLRQVDAGFDSHGVVTLQVLLPDAAYAGERARGFWARLQPRLAALPGVQSAALTSGLPPVAEDSGWGTPIEGYTPVERGAMRSFPTPRGLVPMVDHYQVVSPDYFAALQLQLVAGRALDARDDAAAPKAVVVNQTMARAVWGSESAIGHRLLPSWTANTGELFTIVGVVADVKNDGVDRPTGTALYFAYSQVPEFVGMLRAPYVAVRAGLSAAAIAAAVRREVGAVDPALPLAKVRTLDEVVAASQARPRFFTLVLTLFAVVSLVLAAVGIYGVISYSIAQRTKELGIRMALGALPGAVLALVLGRGLMLAVAGLLLGLGGALALSRFLAGFLFGVAATDILTFSAVALLLGAVAALASYLAALRATRVDPLVALRSE